MDGIALYLFVLVINPAIHVMLLAAGIMLLQQAVKMRKIPPNAQIYLVALLAVIVIDMSMFGQSWLHSKFGSNQKPVTNPITLSYTNQAVSGTPEFAMREIVRAVHEQNGELFLQYVDVDGILADVAKKIPRMQPTKVKQQILAEITSGKAKLPVQNGGPVMSLFDNWSVGGVPPDDSFFAAIKTAVLSLGILEPRGVNDIAWLRVKIDNARTSNRWTGDGRVRFKLIKEGREYKVLADDQTTAGLMERYKAHVAAP